MILAAFCFARGSPAWEARLLADPRFGPRIRAWRDHRSIDARAKFAAAVAFVASPALGWWLLDGHWRWIPTAATLIGGT